MRPPGLRPGGASSAAVKAIRLLDVRDVRGLLDHSVPRRPGIAAASASPSAGGHDGVVGAREDERRRRDLREPRSEVGVGERVAAGGIPLDAGSTVSIVRNRATTSGCAARNDGRNQRPSTASAIASMPWLRTRRGAVEPPLRGRNAAPCSTARAGRRARARSRRATCPRAPPRERPQNETRSGPSSSSSDEVAAEIVDRRRAAGQRGEPP